MRFRPWLNIILVMTCYTGTQAQGAVDSCQGLFSEWRKTHRQQISKLVLDDLVRLRNDLESQTPSTATLSLRMQYIKMIHEVAEDHGMTAAEVSALLAKRNPRPAPERVEEVRRQNQTANEKQVLYALNASMPHEQSSHVVMNDLGTIETLRQLNTDLSDSEWRMKFRHSASFSVTTDGRYFSLKESDEYRKGWFDNKGPQVRVFDSRTGQQVHLPMDHGQLADSQPLFAGIHWGTTTLYDLDTNQEIGRYRGLPTSAPQTLTREYVVLYKVNLLNQPTENLVLYHRLGGTIDLGKTVRLSSDFSRLGFIDKDLHVQIVDLKTGQILPPSMANSGPNSATFARVDSVQEGGISVGDFWVFSKFDSFQNRQDWANAIDLTTGAVEVNYYPIPLPSFGSQKVNFLGQTFRLDWHAKDWQGINTNSRIMNQSLKKEVTLQTRGQQHGISPDQSSAYIVGSAKSSGHFTEIVDLETLVTQQVAMSTRGYIDYDWIYGVVPNPRDNRKDLVAFYSTKTGSKIQTEESSDFGRIDDISPIGQKGAVLVRSATGFWLVAPHGLGPPLVKSLSGDIWKGAIIFPDRRHVLMVDNGQVVLKDFVDPTEPASGSF